MGAGTVVLTGTLCLEPASGMRALVLCMKVLHGTQNTRTHRIRRQRRVGAACAIADVQHQWGTVVLTSTAGRWRRIR